MYRQQVTGGVGTAKLSSGLERLHSFVGAWAGDDWFGQAAVTGRRRTFCVLGMPDLDWNGSPAMPWAE